MFALDILGGHIHVLELVKDADRVNLFGMAEKTYDSEEEFPLRVKEAMNEAKPHAITSRDAIIMIPEEETFIKVVKLPKKEPEELKIHISQEISKILPYAPDEVYWDWRIADQNYEGIAHYDVIVVATARKTVDAYIEILHKAQLETILIETEPNALIWGTINPFHDHQRIEPTLIIDFGSLKTTVVIFARGAIRFTTSIKTEITDQKNFLSESNLQNIAERLNNYLDYYKEQLNHQNDRENDAIKTVIVSGQWGTFHQILAFLEKKLSLPVRGPAKIIPVKPAYARALGLALRGLFE